MFNSLKSWIFAATGVIGGILSSIYGGWTNSLTILVTCMVIDYITGFIVAAVFKNSPKTNTGALSSKIGFIGLLKKGVIMLIVLIACKLDILLNTSFLRDATVIGYILNEVLSIIENAGLMGIPIPSIIQKAVDLLKKESEGGNEAK
jgi:toxin secretion/phage lysis holin